MNNLTVKTRENQAKIKGRKDACIDFLLKLGMKQFWAGHLDADQHRRRLTSGPVKVFEYGKVVDHGPRDDKEVPDGVGERDPAVTLKKHDPGAINDATYNCKKINFSIR